MSKATTNDYARVPVPADARRGRLWIAATSAAWVIAVTTLYTGGSLAESMPMVDVLLAVGVGLGLVAIIGALMGQLGAKYGVSTTMLAHHSFGSLGAALLGIVIALTLGVGWFAWQVSFFATTLRELFPDAAWSEPRWSMIWAGALMTLSAFGGFVWLSRLSMIAVPLVLGLAAYGVIVATANTAADSVVPLTEQTMTALVGATAVVGSVIFGAIVLPDISRFARQGQNGGMTVAGGYALAGAIVMIAGALMVVSVNVPSVGRTANIPAVMSALGLGWGAFVILLFAQWTTNDSNLYSGSLGLAAITRWPKGLLVVLMGAAGIAIASFGIQDQFVPFLVLLGTFIPPVAGVIIADYYLGRSKAGVRFESGAEVPMLNVLALAVVVASGFASSYLAQLHEFLGVTALTSFATALVGYAVLSAIANAVRLPTSFGVSTLK